MSSYLRDCPRNVPTGLSARQNLWPRGGTYPLDADGGVQFQKNGGLFLSARAGPKATGNGDRGEKAERIRFTLRGRAGMVWGVAGEALRIP